MHVHALPSPALSLIWPAEPDHRGAGHQRQPRHLAALVRRHVLHLVRIRRRRHLGLQQRPLPLPAAAHLGEATLRYHVPYFIMRLLCTAYNGIIQELHAYRNYYTGTMITSSSRCLGRAPMAAAVLVRAQPTVDCTTLRLKRTACPPSALPNIMLVYHVCLTSALCMCVCIRAVERARQPRPAAHHLPLHAQVSRLVMIMIAREGEHQHSAVNQAGAACMLSCMQLQLRSRGTSKHSATFIC